MNTTTYHYAAPRRPVAKPVPVAADDKPVPVFVVYHNDLPFKHPVLGVEVEHATEVAAWRAAMRFAGQLHSSLGCFGVQRIDL